MSKVLGLTPDSEIDNAIEEPDMLEQNQILTDTDDMDMGVKLSDIEDEFAIF